MPSQSLANFTQEQKLFTEFMESNDGQNILFFQGKSDCGKSQLVKHCVNLVKKETPSYLTNFPVGWIPIHVLFAQMGKQCGWKNMTNFTEMVDNKLRGTENEKFLNAPIGKKLSAVCKDSDTVNLEEIYIDLSNAWFEDAEKFETPFLLVIDPYDRRTEPFDEWFREWFLEGVATCNGMRVVVSGEEVPALEGDWIYSSKKQELKVIDNAQTWMAWANKEGYPIPSEHALSEVIQSANGNYNHIVDLIGKKFPKKHIFEVITSNEWRVQLKEKMHEVFNIEELKTICFELDIDYEDIPDHEKGKEVTIRELISKCKRKNKLDDLFQKCKAKRPDNNWVAIY